RRNNGSVRSDFTREWRDDLVGIMDPTGFSNIRLSHISWIINDENDRQNIAISMNSSRHCRLIALGSSGAGQIRLLEMVGRIYQCVAFPATGRKSGPFVRGVRRWVRAAIQVNHLFRFLPGHMEA